MNHDGYTGFLHRRKSFITHFTLDFHLRLLLSFKSYLILFFLMTEMIDMPGKVKEISVTTGLTLILARFSSSSEHIKKYREEFNLANVTVFREE